MDNLSQIIESYYGLGKPWTFYDFVINNAKLCETEKSEFVKIYKEAAKFEFWNFSNLSEGAENATIFLKSNTQLSAEAINRIVNAIAYEWK
jgi:hypothetical protein